MTVPGVLHLTTELALSAPGTPLRLPPRGGLAARGFVTENGARRRRPKVSYGRMTGTPRQAHWAAGGVPPPFDKDMMSPGTLRSAATD